MAAWYHDAVYDPARLDNEERSAALASTQLAGVGVGPAIVGEVERLVLLTRTHDPGEDDVAGQLLSDADLGILAAPPEVYDAYAAAVRAEYAHIPDPEFRAGRCAVLSALADRQSLFRTRHAQLEWERPARANLVRELARLRER
jgi:predicted metal-dependent HD superfamily phosphohydrolase